MKSASFAYFAPGTRAEIIALLGHYGDEAKVLAGGQSLVPAMNFRLARPGVLIDVNRAPGLDEVRADAGVLRIGARARHARFERPVADGPLGALLPRVAAHIAHAPIRSRGTFGGSLAHADPASEWCALALALGAEIVAEGPGGERVIPADRFFTTIFTTALRPDELLTEIRLKLLDPSWRCGFAEFSRRAGDYALAMAVVAVRLEGGTIRDARIGLGGVASTPVAAPASVQALIGQKPTAEVIDAAAALAASALNPSGDIHASPELRRDLARTMVQRALLQAVGS